MRILIINIILMSLLVILALIIHFKTSKRRSNALLVLYIRSFIKIIISISGFLALVMYIPQSLYFIGYILSFIIVCFSLDIIIENDGIYYGFNLLPWRRIIKITDHPSYLMIVTDRKLSRKYFLKLIWKISSEDSERITHLHKAKAKF